MSSDLIRKKKSRTVGIDDLSVDGLTEVKEASSHSNLGHLTRQLEDFLDRRQEARLKIAGDGGPIDGFVDVLSDVLQPIKQPLIDELGLVGEKHIEEWNVSIPDKSMDCKSLNKWRRSHAKCAIDVDPCASKHCANKSISTKCNNATRLSISFDIIIIEETKLLSANAFHRTFSDDKRIMGKLGRYFWTEFDS